MSAAAIVREKEHEGVSRHARLVERCEESADALIQAIDHRRISLHSRLLSFARNRIQPLPGRKLVLVQMVERGGRKLRGGGVEQSHRELAFEPAFAGRLVSVTVFRTIAGDVLCWRMDRIMRSGVADIEEEGTRRFCRPSDHVDALAGKRIGRVEISGKVSNDFLIAGKGPRLAAMEFRVWFGRIEVMAESVESPIELIEAAINCAVRRAGPELPFSNQCCGVAGVTQR